MPGKTMSDELLDDNADAEFLQDRRVDVYRNLNDDCLSIRDMDPDSEHYQEVIGHVDMVLIRDPEFVSNPAGREDVRESGVKNVHAFVRGHVSAVDLDAQIEWRMMNQLFSNDVCNVNYDPFEMDGFEVTTVFPNRMTDHDLTEGDEIESATYACVADNGVGVMLPDPSYDRDEQPVVEHQG